MSESIQAAVDLLTAAAAFGAFGVSQWNAYQFSVLKGRVVEQGDNDIFFGGPCRGLG